MANRYSLLDYQTSNGDIPFKEWLESLRDTRTRARIAMAINRMELGNFGDSKGIDEGLMERRLDFGPGYRVYYALYPTHIVLLFCGGDKSTQKEDIKRAKAYKRDYESR